ncbi:Heme-binding protein 1 [Chionoecetes opilio]|uniref:Heme-binding protein 1 n=1 Tax=Chionoecetes opilio TaxID=41210 RepID=A0A8J5CRG4_CHIOP|nr:Heme-binding protein 1 [Chionoecetes opilio]
MPIRPLKLLDVTRRHYGLRYQGPYAYNLHNLGHQSGLTTTPAYTYLTKTRHLDTRNFGFTAFSRGFEHQEEIQSTLLNTGHGWESREVPSKVWVCTRQHQAAHNAHPTTADQVMAFLRLFAYLNGRNNEDRNLPMGTPVSIEARTTDEGRVLSACFFLPQRIQSNPPTPRDPLVYLSHRPSVTIFTRRFGGFASNEDTWMAEAQALKQVLTAQGQQTRADIQYWNAYDPPYKFWNRRNEVWLVRA